MTFHSFAISTTFHHWVWLNRIRKNCIRIISLCVHLASIIIKTVNVCSTIQRQNDVCVLVHQMKLSYCWWACYVYHCYRANIKLTGKTSHEECVRVHWKYTMCTPSPLPTCIFITPPGCNASKIDFTFKWLVLLTTSFSVNSDGFLMTNVICYSESCIEENYWTNVSN